MIGRNEAPRLEACLRAVRGVERLVYVDSASTDGSAELAERLGVETLRLDESQPLSAARARNAGFEHLRARHPEVEYVQFVDGDCVLDPDWLDRAVEALRADAQLALVCGRLSERAPEATIYNFLYDLEWDRPAGPTAACGGLFLARSSAYERVGGFDPSLAAGEEAELCWRIRRTGAGIRRLAEPMATHDGAMTRFRDWWKRCRRSGYVYAQGFFRHGFREEPQHVRRLASAVAWTALAPLALATAWLTRQPAFAWLLLFYPVQVLRLARSRARGGSGPARALACAGLTLFGKAPEFLGACHCTLDRALQRRAPLIEYK